MQDYAESGRNKDERNGTAGIVLHKDAGSARQGAYDRCSIRVFEERLAAEPNGDWLSGSRDSQKAVSNFLIETAKQNDFYIPEQQLQLLGERKHLPSGESIIYENAAQSVVYKVRDPFAKFQLKSGRAIDVLYDHVVHNMLFPEAQYRLVGVSSCIDDVRFVLAQQLFYTQGTPSQQQIDEYLVSMGLMPEERYYYGNEYVAVTDISATSDNVLLDKDGRLLFIDPIIKMKKSVDEIISAFPFISHTLPKKPNLLDRIIGRVRRGQ